MHIRRLVESATFSTFVVTVIGLNAVLIGLSTSLTDATSLRAIAGIDTSASASSSWRSFFVFSAGDSAAAFFRNGWNIFDLRHLRGQ